MRNYQPADFRNNIPMVPSGRPGDRLSNELRKDIGWPNQPSEESLAAFAAKVIRLRDMRGSFVTDALFSEPGWEMLLALFRADAAGHRMTISKLCSASKAPDTTALRWIEKLTALGMVTRMANPLDARVFFIGLQADTRRAVRAYLLRVWSELYAQSKIL